MHLTFSRPVSTSIQLQNLIPLPLPVDLPNCHPNPSTILTVNPPHRPNRQLAALPILPILPIHPSNYPPNLLIQARRHPKLIIKLAAVLLRDIGDVI